MRVIAILVFLVGIALAGGGAYYASKYLERYQTQVADAKPGLETVDVVVATADMHYGQELSGKQLKFTPWPKASVPDGAFTDGEKLMGLDGNVKRTVLQPIKAGEPILASKVTKLGDKPRLAFNLTEGKRAFSFAINATTAVAGFVQAGDRVDLLLTRDIEGQMRTEVFMQNVKIIAIDQDTDASSRGARIGRLATIEVDPIDVQKLTIAQSSGKFSLALRGVNDDLQDPSQLTPMTSADLFGEKVEEVKPVIEKNTVRVRKGGQVESVEID